MEGARKRAGKMEVGVGQRGVPPGGAAKVYACVRWCGAQRLERREQAAWKEAW